MNAEWDVIIIGSGPAGVSAAFPLVKAGVRVLMLDGGKRATHTPVTENFLDARATDKHQLQWLLGKNFHAIQQQSAISPKLRVPNLAYVFEQFAAGNRIQAEHFHALGSLATGGLSNAWGAGVAQFSVDELKKFPVPVSEWQKHYRSVGERMGLSGKNGDDMADYFGVDDYAEPAMAIDDLHGDFFKRYQQAPDYFSTRGFRMGRSRIAVLTKDQGDRKACSRLGNCLFGCANRAIYSAQDDLPALKQFPNFLLQAGVIVDQVENHQGVWTACGHDAHTKNSVHVGAKKIILAAGTLATTALALRHFGNKDAVSFLSSPTAAFLAWNYRRFGAPHVQGFGLGQLSYTIEVEKSLSAFGSTFSTTGIPVAEFAKSVPLRRTIAIDVLSVLLSSCVVGNIFLPGHLTQARAHLNSTGALVVQGKYSDDLVHHMAKVATRVKQAFFKMGGWVLPGSFTLGQPGADIHYAGSLPLCEKPQRGQCNAYGELAGAPGLFVVDGACLPILPEKSHTLTIMANAERISTALVQSFQSNEGA